MVLLSKRPVTAPVRSAPPKRIVQNADNVMVAVRVRPFSAKEMIDPRWCNVIHPVNDKLLIFDPDHGQAALGMDLRPGVPAHARKPKDATFSFDSVFDEKSTQKDVFEKTACKLVPWVMKGGNCTVFAYGATGAGKTHTMMGTSDDPGVMYRTMEELFHKIDEESQIRQFRVDLSYIEVYNENIRDLLTEGVQGLPLRQSAGKGVVVAGVKIYHPTTPQQVMHLLQLGNMNRSMAGTEANKTSSRSHAVLQVIVESRELNGVSNKVQRGKISLIDLAGSERASATQNRGDRLQEGANINKSLLALGNCINALADSSSRASHVPYRNSKLTRLLQDSLGGNCRTIMIANVSPSSMSYEDCHNTLKYANRAKNIKTKQNVHQESSDVHMAEYQQRIVELQAQVETLKASLLSRQNAAPSSVSLDAESEKASVMKGQVEAQATKLLAAKSTYLDQEDTCRRADYEREWRQDALSAWESRPSVAGSAEPLPITTIRHELDHYLEVAHKARSAQVALQAEVDRELDVLNIMQSEVSNHLHHPLLRDLIDSIIIGAKRMADLIESDRAAAISQSVAGTLMRQLKHAHRVAFGADETARVVDAKEMPKTSWDEELPSTPDAKTPKRMTYAQRSAQAKKVMLSVKKTPTRSSRRKFLQMLQSPGGQNDPMMAEAESEISQLKKRPIGTASARLESRGTILPNVTPMGTRRGKKPSPPSQPRTLSSRRGRRSADKTPTLPALPEAFATPSFSRPLSAPGMPDSSLPHGPEVVRRRTRSSNDFNNSKLPRRSMSASQLGTMDVEDELDEY